MQRKHKSDDGIEKATRIGAYRKKDRGGNQLSEHDGPSPFFIRQMWEELNPFDTQGHSSYSSSAACAVFMTLATLSIDRGIRIQKQTKAPEAALDKVIDFSARFGA